MNVSRAVDIRSAQVFCQAPSELRERAIKNVRNLKFFALSVINIKICDPTSLITESSALSEHKTEHFVKPEHVKPHFHTSFAVTNPSCPKPFAPQCAGFSGKSGLGFGSEPLRSRFGPCNFLHGGFSHFSR